MPDWALWGIVGVAFLAGYSLVSFVMKRVKELQNRPSMMEDLFRESPDAGGSGRTSVTLPPAEADAGQSKEQPKSGPETLNPG
jgi:hypothetical protein